MQSPVSVPRSGHALLKGGAWQSASDFGRPVSLMFLCPRRSPCGDTEEFTTSASASTVGTSAQTPNASPAAGYGRMPPSPVKS